MTSAEPAQDFTDDRPVKNWTFPPDYPEDWRVDFDPAPEPITGNFWFGLFLIFIIITISSAVVLTAWAVS